MATLFVNKSGNNADSGATRALAKLTIAGAISAAASGDTIMIGTGIYREGDFVTVKDFRFTADGGFGTVILDGNLTNNYFYAFPNGATLFFLDGLILRNYITDGLQIGASNGSPVVRLFECMIVTSGNGINQTASNLSTIIASYTVFANNARGILQSHAGSIVNLQNCTFVGNTTTCITFAASSSTTSRIINTIFSNSPTLLLASGMTDAQYSARFLDHDFNDYHLGSGTNMLTTSTASRTTIAGVRTATGKDANSIASDPLFVRTASYLFGLQAASPCSGVGQAGVDIGAFRSVFGVTSAVNASMWTGGVFSSTEISGNTIILSAGPAEGTFATDVIDHGRSRSMRKVRLGGLYDGTANFDTTKTDVEPNRWTLEVRASDTLFAKADGSPAWSEKEIGTTVSGVTGRYQQARVTLRTDNVEA